MKDWPRVAKIQSDLLAYALATRQTRVASYMLTKCQGVARFPWLGHTAARHHDYTHKDGKAPGSTGAEGQRILRDICRWHVEEFAYLVGKLKSIPEGDGTVLDNTLLVFVHEHAEANIHKASGMIAILAGVEGPPGAGPPHARLRHVRRPLPHAGRRRSGRRPGHISDRDEATCRDPRVSGASAGGTPRRKDRSGFGCRAWRPEERAIPACVTLVSCTSRNLQTFPGGQFLQGLIVHARAAFETELLHLSEDGSVCASPRASMSE